METIGAGNTGQRVDNFLVTRLKGVPKSRIYRALRSGEVRINGSRCKPARVLCTGDVVRIPPLRRATPRETPLVPGRLADEIAVLHEDETVLIVDKPSGLAVHGGSGMEYGLIEALRQLRNNPPFLELAHRLDRETSGCLVLAKSRPSLLGIQRQWQATGEAGKQYVTLLRGHWQGGEKQVNHPLARGRRDGLARMHVDPSGQSASTVFTPRLQYANCSLVGARLLTGRMHQVRVHAAAEGHPVAGDRVYGDFAFNREMARQGLTRLFLHAERIRFTHPDNGEMIDCRCPLPADLKALLAHLDSGASGEGDAPRNAPGESA